MTNPDSPTVLGEGDIARFIDDGFVRLDAAFPAELASECRARLWRDTGCDPDDRATWTRPVVRLGLYSDAPFRAAANSARLTAAYDQLAGPGRWLPVGAVGTFPVRFPSADAPGDDGWHVDASIPGDDPGNIFSTRTNVHSDGRALLLLLLFSDVGPDDAPTRIRVGSHKDVARALRDKGERGLDVMELVAAFGASAGREVVTATGPAGTAYLCHPFLVHAAQAHTGNAVKFMAQPPLLPRGRFDILAGDSPVEVAIRKGLAEA